MVVLPLVGRRVTSFLDRSLEGVWPIIAPVPVKVQSETPSSRCRGELRALAIFDLGESRYDLETDLETDREKWADRLPL
jgi:hypothetical protein